MYIHASNQTCSHPYIIANYAHMKPVMAQVMLCMPEWALSASAEGPRPELTSQIPYRVFGVSTLGIILVDLGIYLVCGYLDPQGVLFWRVWGFCIRNHRICGLVLVAWDYTAEERL